MRRSCGGARAAGLPEVETVTLAPKDGGPEALTVKIWAADKVGARKEKAA